MNKIYLCLLFITVILVSCNNGSSNKDSDVSESSISFNQMLDDYYEEYLRLYPLSATMLGDNRYNDTLPDFLSDEFIAMEKSFYAKYRELAGKFPDEDLSYQENISKVVLLWECDINLHRLEFREELIPITPDIFSHMNSFGQLAGGKSDQPFISIEDYENWPKRVDDHLKWMVSAENRMKEGIESGYVLPEKLIVKILPQLKPFMSENPDTNPFFGPVNNFPESFSEDVKEELTREYTLMITVKVIPAYKRLYEFVSTTYLDAGRETSGLWDIPDGKNYYAFLIKRYTTTSMTADEIFQTGLNEVERITTEMTEIKDKLGYSGDLKSFNEFVRNNKDLKPFTEPQQILGHFIAIHNRVKPNLEYLFDLKPKTPLEIRQAESFLGESGAPFYFQGTADGSRPGVFYVIINVPEEYNVFKDEVLYLHEAIPGHHYQFSLALENQELSKFRRMIWHPGYGEGWALYCESLGEELGLYTDPYQYFGMLSNEMHRAIRLVVDVGIHNKGWTREQAIDYSLEHEPESEEYIISEIERYMAWPGQALAYKIGQFKMIELRERAKKELGNRFDIKEFHNQVLRSGSVPLAILEKIIDQWIESIKDKGMV